MSYRTAGIVIGIFTGFFSAMTGVGGGAILVSLMVNFMGMSQHRAHGTSLTVIILTSLASAFGYVLPFITGGSVSSDYQYNPTLTLTLIPVLAFASMFGVVLGAKIMTKLPSKQLRRLFGVFLFFVSIQALSTLVPGTGFNGTTVPADMGGTYWKLPEFLPVWIALGFAAGVGSGILGIGGALIMVPFMTVGAGIERHLTQGITLAVICITTLTGGYTHYKLGNVDMKATVAIAPMAAIVGLVTSRFIATQISTPWLTGVFGLAMLYFAYQFTFVTAKPKPAPAATDATSTTR